MAEVHNLFEEDQTPAPADGAALVLNLEGFEGPIDLLLTLARDQKVDLTKISILALAEQYLTFNHPADQPVCWSLMGYASGWSTAFFGSPLIAIEPVCMGKGDDHCEWKIQSPEDWGDEARPYIEALAGLLGG